MAEHVTRRVLLVEDDAAYRDLLGDALALRGFECVAAGSVADARRRYAEDAYAALVLDYDLPDGTGLDFLAGVDRGAARVVLFSGVDRDRELAAAHLDVDRQIPKDRPDLLLDYLGDEA